MLKKLSTNKLEGRKAPKGWNPCFAICRIICNLEGVLLGTETSVEYSLG